MYWQFPTLSLPVKRLSRRLLPPLAHGIQGMAFRRSKLSSSSPVQCYGCAEGRFSFRSHTHKRDPLFPRDMIRTSHKRSFDIARFDLTDFGSSVIQPLLPNKSRGVPRVDDRRVLNGIFWRSRTGAPWADIPARYGPYTTCVNRFNRRRLGKYPRHAATCRSTGLQRLALQEMQRRRAFLQ
jgi:transposase